MKLTFFRTQDRIEGLAIEEAQLHILKGQGMPGALGAPARLRTTELEDQWTLEPSAPEAAPPPTSDKQFFALYLDPASNRLVVPISNTIDPKFEGSDEKTDVEMRIELDALHLPGEGVKSGTVRIQVSQDGRFLRGRDALHWVVAAGLDLYKTVQDGRSKIALKPHELKADMGKPFIGRPVALPGGAGYLKVDVLQDKEKSLIENIWSSIVSLFGSPQGKALAATVGFPALGLPAVSFVDQLIETYRTSNAEAVIEGQQMRWVFNKSALERVKLGAGDLVHVPVMNQGYFVMVPAGRVTEVMSTEPRYMSGFGYLCPGSVDLSNQVSLAKYLDDVANNDYPYRNLPYAVLGVELRETSSTNW